MEFHGIEMEGPLVIERLTTLPSATLEDVGRILYIEEDKEVYIGTTNQIGSATWRKVSEGSRALPENASDGQIPVFKDYLDDWVAEDNIHDAIKIKGKNVSGLINKEGQVLEYNGVDFVPTLTNARKIQGKDVSSNNPEKNQVLSFDGDKYTPSFIDGNLIGLFGKPVDESDTPLNKEGIYFSGEDGTWKTGPVNAGQLQDKSINPQQPQHLQALVYSADTDKYEPTTINGNIILSTDTTLTVKNNPTENEFASINEALEYLDNFRIGYDAHVTIKVEDGIYTVNEEIQIKHPDGRRLSIIGNEEGVKEYIIESGNNEKIVINTNAYTENIQDCLQNGHLIAIDNGDDKSNGAYQVDRYVVESNKTTIWIKGAAIPTSNVTGATVKIFPACKCHLQVNGDFNCFVASEGSAINGLRGMFISEKLSRSHGWGNPNREDSWVPHNPPAAIKSSNNGFIYLGGEILVDRMGIGLFSRIGSTITGVNTCVIHGTKFEGVKATVNSFIGGQRFYLGFIHRNGVLSENESIVSCMFSRLRDIGVISKDGGSCFVSINNSHLEASSCVTNNPVQGVNDTSGNTFYATHNSSIKCEFCKINYGINAFIADRNSLIEGAASTIRNTIIGAAAYYNSHIKCGASNFDGINSPIFADNGGIIEANNSILKGNGSGIGIYSNSSRISATTSHIINCKGIARCINNGFINLSNGSTQTSNTHINGKSDHLLAEKGGYIVIDNGWSGISGAPTIGSGVDLYGSCITDQVVDDEVELIPDFYAEEKSGDSPFAVVFKNNTNIISGVSWLWDFGDGNSSSDQNPIHTYSGDGTYTVTLTATHEGRTVETQKTDYIIVSSGSVTIDFDSNIDTKSKLSWDFFDPYKMADFRNSNYSSDISLTDNELLVSGVWSDEVIQTPWTNKGVIPKLRDFVSCIYNNNLYIWGGYDQGDVLNNKMWKYNFSDGSWEIQTENNPITGKAHCRSVVIGDKWYVVNGWDGENYSYRLWEFNFSTNTWTRKADAPSNDFILLSPNPVVVSDKFYALLEGTLYSYTPSSDTWNEKKDLGIDVSSNIRAMISYNNKIYYFKEKSGWDQTTKHQLCSYNPTTDQLIENIIEEFIPAYYDVDANSVLVDNKWYLFNVNTWSFYEIDLEKEKFTYRDCASSPLKNGKKEKRSGELVVYNNKVYIVGYIERKIGGEHVFHNLEEWNPNWSWDYEKIWVWENIGDNWIVKHSQHEIFSNNIHQTPSYFGQVMSISDNILATVKKYYTNVSKSDEFFEVVFYRKNNNLWTYYNNISLGDGKEYPMSDVQLSLDWTNNQIAISYKYSGQLNVDIYTFTGGSWSKFQSITPKIFRKADAVCINGDYIFTTVNNDLYIYKWNGSTFAYHQTIIANTIEDWGKFIEYSNNKLYIPTTNAKNGDKIFIYELNGSNWENTKIVNAGINIKSGFSVNSNDKISISTINRKLWKNHILVAKPIYSIDVGETIMFSGSAIGFTPSNWYWDFGDGENSTEQNPYHTFNTPGKFDIMLIGENGNQRDSESKKNYVVVT